MNILVVEDELNVQKLIRVHLEREGLTVTACTSGEEALELVKKTSFDLVLLDWMLKGKLTGLDVCKKIAGNAPILMLTSRSSATDVVLGLEMGADDYVTKPFEIPVLVARVRALLRRSSRSEPAASEEKIVGDLRVNIPKVEVECCGKPVKLTSSEFRLLATLLNNQGKVLSRDQLLKSIQEQGVVVVDRVIDTHIYTLRSKLGKCADFIETLRGIGYRIKG